MAFGLTLSIVAVTEAQVTGNAGAPAPPISVSLAADKVTATGVTPKGDAVLFAVMRDDGHGYHSIRQRFLMATDSTGTGLVTFSLKAIPRVAVVGVVDMSSGRIGYLSPTVKSFANLTFPQQGPEGVKKNATDSDQVQIVRQLVTLVVVRPHVGAWYLTNGDGGAADADHAHDGRISWNLDSLQPIEAKAGKPPKHFTPHDLIIAIDPIRMEYFTQEVGQ